MMRFFLSCLCLLAWSTHASAQNFEIDITQFDSWIFSNLGNTDNARQTLADRAEMEIDRMSLSTPLRDDQIKKLRFAATGDIKRFYDDVDQAHREFYAMQKAGEIGQENVNELYQLAAPLMQRLNNGLFGETSLLKKVARGCVDKEQAAVLREREERRRKLKSEIAITSYVATLGRQIPMTQTQRADLMTLLTENVQLSDPNHQYISYLLMYEMSKLPKLKTILDDAQYKAIEKNFQRGVMMKATLKDAGLLDEE
ncbi:hypothetical protein [Allorhodopirellula heiligendammensis]|uniref:DUF4142 domain-containing protein n=1 Tax=Allorhodopirellula heiligendammensis TaxID=2714739 RepID=A0A5C6C3Q3_9BACT|nr:hypothetical protein [Allorhodopirellula heiligendammensis]TWU17924.1 hypothetical protein Poly21_00760 [Allorhodopirellula heiligendammensis]